MIGVAVVLEKSVTIAIWCLKIFNQIIYLGVFNYVKCKMTSQINHVWHWAIKNGHLVISRMSSKSKRSYTGIMRASTC